MFRFLFAGSDRPFAFEPQSYIFNFDELFSTKANAIPMLLQVKRSLCYDMLLT